MLPLLYLVSARNEGEGFWWDCKWRRHALNLSVELSLLLVSVSSATQFAVLAVVRLCSRVINPLYQISHRGLDLLLAQLLIIIRLSTTILSSKYRQSLRSHCSALSLFTPLARLEQLPGIDRRRTKPTKEEDLNLTLHNSWLASSSYCCLLFLIFHD